MSTAHGPLYCFLWADKSVMFGSPESGRIDWAGRSAVAVRAAHPRPHRPQLCLNRWAGTSVAEKTEKELRRTGNILRTMELSIASLGTYVEEEKAGTLPLLPSKAAAHRMIPIPTNT
jgi:hypothetical protein